MGCRYGGSPRPSTVTTSLPPFGYDQITDVSPEEHREVLDRFRQIEPKVLLAHDGYPYNGRFFDRSAEVWVFIQ